VSNVLDYGVNGQQPSRVGGTGTAIKYFPRLLGINGAIIGSAGLGGVSGSSVAAPLFGTSPATPSTTNASGALFLPAANSYNGQLFNILAVGNIGNDSGDPSATVNVILQAVTGRLTAPVYTTIASTSALVPGFQPDPFMLDVQLFGDATSGILSGYYTAMLGTTVHSTSGTSGSVATDVAITGLDFLNGNPNLQQGAVLGFVVGVQFGTSDPTNKASLFEFTVES
jgi:hypothetical protein